MIDKNDMKNKTIVVMGGGTAGWVSALYFLNKNKDLNLNQKIKLISSNDIEPIGVGEGTLPSFPNFIEKICKIDKKEFLKETKGSFKFGVKFDNWNFDNEYFYNLVVAGTNYKLSNEDKKLSFDFIQYAINNNISIPQKSLLKKIIGEFYDIIENNKIALNMIPGYAYHFSASLLIAFLRKKCIDFEEFEHIEGTIENISYNESGIINTLKINNQQKISGDFFINCLGFKSNTLLSEEYFDVKNWDNYILNNSAFAIQVKNSSTEIIEPYTTAKAQEYGWSWKIPQYEKTGYGYVYSDNFINDEDKLYEDLLKTYNIKEKDVFKTRVVKSKPYLNKKQLHKNCLSLGLASGFVEPLEATSIHMTLLSLDTFFEMIENDIKLDQKCIDSFNERLERSWRNVFKFIIHHYFTNNPINDYWKHYKNIQENNVFDFYEKHNDNSAPFNSYTYFLVSLGKKMKDYYYGFEYEKYLKDNFQNFLRIDTNINLNGLCSHNEVLDKINQKNILKNSSYS
jgi:tryptophan halogenase